MKKLGTVIQGPPHLMGQPVTAVVMPEIRQLAVKFYLDLLAASVGGGGVEFIASANRVGAPWPECGSTGSIIDEAVKKLAEIGNFHTAKEHKGLAEHLLRYLGTTFFVKLREARIFQFKERDYVTLYHLADVFTTIAAGVKWSPPREVRLPDDEPDSKTVCEYTVNEGSRLAFPERLPFKSSYFAWGAGVLIPGMLAMQYGYEKSITALIMGTLVTDDGWCFTVGSTASGLNRDILRQSPALALAQTLQDGSRYFVVLERVGDHTDTLIQFEQAPEHEPLRHNLINPGWTLPFALTPWIVTQAVDVINANDSLTQIQPGLLKERLAAKALSKRTRQQFLPRPYYTVIVQPTTYEEVEQRIKSQPREWAYRWDVRGHAAHRIMRGTLPLDPKLVWQLHKRGYEIFHALNRPTGEALALLIRRRIVPPREGEWLAYLRWWRNAFVKGPPDKPHIQSVHRLRRGVPSVV